LNTGIRQITSDGINSGDQSLRQSVNEEEQLRISLFLARQRGESFDLVDRDQLALNYAELERKLRVVADILCKRPRQGHRVSAGVGNRADTFQGLQSLFDFGALRRTTRQRILHHLVLAAGGANGLAQLEILRNRQLAEGA